MYWIIKTRQVETMTSLQQQQHQQQVFRERTGVQSDREHSVAKQFYKDVERNSHGVLLMKNRKYGEAVQFFQAALDDILPRVENEVTFPLDLSSSPEKQTIGNIKGIEVRDPADQEHFDEENDVYLLYDRALHVSVEMKDVLLNTMLCNHLLFVTLTYNIGLAHHLEGIRSGRSRFLQRSLSFYTVAYSSLIKQHAKSPACPCLALLALINNIGHVHGHFRNLAATELCSDELAYQLVTRNPPVEERQPFCSNALFFHKNQFSGAPAA